MPQQFVHCILLPYLCTGMTRAFLQSSGTLLKLRIMLLLSACGIHQSSMEEHFASQPCDTVSFRGKDWEVSLQTFEDDSTIPTSSQEG